MCRYIIFALMYHRHNILNLTFFHISRKFIFMKWSRDSAVGIPTGYGLDNREVGVPVLVGSRIFSSPCRPDRFRGPHSLLSNGYSGGGGGTARGMKLTTHLQLVTRAGKRGSIRPLPSTPISATTRSKA
jgi:hypothetical protein